MPVYSSNRTIGGEALPTFFFLIILTIVDYAYFRYLVYFSTAKHIHQRSWITLSKKSTLQASMMLLFRGCERTPLNTQRKLTYCLLCSLENCYSSISTTLTRAEAPERTKRGSAFVNVVTYSAASSLALLR